MRRLGGAWVALLLLACCSEEAPAAEDCEGMSYVPWVREMPFDSFPGLKPSFEIATLAGQRTISGKLHFGAYQLWGYSLPASDGDIVYCPAQDADVTASVGTFSSPVTKTRWVCERFRDAMLCDSPSFVGALPLDFQPPEIDLVLADDSTSLTYPLGDALLERTISLVGQTEWTFAADQPITVAWSPATERGGLRVEFRAGDGTRHPATDVLHGPDGTIRLSFSGVTGRGSLEITMMASMTFADYTLSVTNTVEHFADLVP